LAIPGNFLSATTESIDPNTSGWTPKTNCTLTLGGGGRNGDGCLSVRSVASGEMQVRTVSSYPVTEGLPYYAFSDASGSTVPERIGIRWLNAAGTEISVTWSLTTLTASATWHRISVAGPAPVGATQAQVLLSSTPAAAAVFSFFENVYLGPPIRSAGNLFTFGAESSEIDATGWAVDTNCTLARQVPVVSWAVNWYYAGGHTMAMTVTANGNATMRTVERPAVTAGTEYVGYIYLSPPTSGSTAWVELRFYDASNAQIQATRSTLAAPGTGFYRQIVSDIAPAGAVTCGLTVGLDSATAGQIVRVDTAVVAVAPKIVAGTVVPYANSSFEQSNGSWTVPSGVATIARSTPWGTAGFIGNYSLAVSSATATSSTLRSPRFTLPATAPGLNWRGQVVLKVNAGSWSGVTLRLHWYDASNADLGASTGTAFVLPGGGWYALSHDNTAPAGAAKAEIEVVLTAGAVSSSLWMDAAALWQVLPNTDAQVVADGGYVNLTLRELPVDYLLTVSRVTPDGNRTLVRGPSGLTSRVTITSDLTVLEDHEAPLNTVVIYYVEMFTTAGVLWGTRTSSHVTVPHDDPNEVWLKDPGYPTRNLKVLVARAPDWQRPIEQSTPVVRGRRNKVILSGLRQGLEGDLSVITRSDQERIALHVLADSGNVLLWQAAPGAGVDDMYVGAGQITEARTSGTAAEPWRVWTLPLTQTDMPATTGVNGAAGRTWQDILTENATWQQVLDKYATWEDLFLNRPK